MEADGIGLDSPPAPASDSGAARPRRARPSAPARSPGRRRRAARRRGVAVLLIVALAASWAAFQPVRASTRATRCSTRVERSQLDAAANIARIGESRNPLSVDPLFELAYVETLRDDPQAAQAALEHAVRLQPANPATWRRLGHLRLDTCSTSPRRRCATSAPRYYLDPAVPVSTSDFVAAQRAVAARKKGP